MERRDDLGPWPIPLRKACKTVALSKPPSSLVACSDPVGLRLLYFSTLVVVLEFFPPSLLSLFSIFLLVFALLSSCFSCLCLGWKGSLLQGGRVLLGNRTCGEEEDVLCERSVQGESGGEEQLLGRGRLRNGVIVV